MFFLNPACSLPNTFHFSESFRMVSVRSAVKSFHRQLKSEKEDFVPLLQRGCVSEKSSGVRTLQAAEPPYSVNNGPIK